MLSLEVIDKIVLQALQRVAFLRPSGVVQRIYLAIHVLDDAASIRYRDRRYSPATNVSPKLFFERRQRRFHLRTFCVLLGLVYPEQKLFCRN